MLKQSFAKPALAEPTFEEPTDAEISALLGGKPVYSLRPEDVDDISCVPEDTDAESDRKVGLFKERYPQLGLLNDIQIERILRQKSGAQVFPLPLRDRWEDVLYILLLRPSQNKTMKQEFRCTTFLDEGNIVDCLPSAYIRFIMCAHEVGHMLQHHIGMWRGSLGLSMIKNAEIMYAEEALADYYALRQFEKRDGPKEMVQNCIASRALAGYCSQPSRYFVAPQLSAWFFGQGNEEFLAYQDIRSAYHELRFRTIGACLNGMRLDYISSSDIWNEQRKIDTDLLYAHNDLRHMISRTRRIHEEEEVRYKVAINDGTLFAELARVVRDVEMDPFTRACGEQILDAVRLICPSLYPESIMKRTKTHESAGFFL